MTQQLAAIYQALSMVKTCGQDTIIMADCLQALAKAIDAASNVAAAPMIEEKGDE